MKRYLYLIIAAAAIAVLASCCKNSGYGYEIRAKKVTSIEWEEFEDEEYGTCGAIVVDLEG